MLEAAAELHAGTPPVGLDIFAQRRDLEGHAFDDDGHRAVLDPGRNAAQAGSLGAPHCLVRQRGRGEIDFTHLDAQDRIADRAADDASLLAIAVENAKDGGNARIVEDARTRERSVVERQQTAHSP